MNKERTTNAIDTCKKLELAAGRESYFDTAALIHLDGPYDLSESLTAALFRSSALRFIVLAGFHDAEIVTMRLDTVYGKEAWEWTIDFRRAIVNYFKRGYNRFKLTFINAEFQKLYDEMDFDARYALISTSLTERNGRFEFAAEVFANIPRHEYYDKFSVTFTDLKVAPIL